MGPQSCNESPLPDEKVQVPCTPTCNVVAGAFLELFQLLEDYAPVWYTEQHHARALAAIAILQKP